MTVKNSITLDEFIKELTAIAEVDPVAMGKLAAHRVPCNKKLADHPSVQVHSDGVNVHLVGMVGIINGIFGMYDDGPKKDWGAVAAVIELEDRSCARFSKIENKEAKQ